MPIEILMPALSPTMTEGNLAKWLKKEGDTIKPGEVIAEIETDKATMEVEAVDQGKLAKILVPAGSEGVKVNRLIALLLEEGEDPKSVVDYKPKLAANESKQAEAAAAPAAATAAPTAAPAAPALAPQATKAPVAAQAAPQAAAGGRVKASPLAKRLAASAGVDLGNVIGTGPHGRILKADIEDAQKRGPGGGGRVVRNPVEFATQPNTTMRKVIARRLTESKQQVPHFYLTVECTLDKLLEARHDLNSVAPETAEKKPAYKASVNDFIIKAAAIALKKVPAANASWYDDAIVLYNNIDIAVAVAIDGGLVTPVLRNADQKSIPTISNEMKTLVARAREGKLKPEEMQGGGFSLSNLGMFGIKQFSAIINPPQACILAVGAGEQVPVVNHGKIEIATRMTATLSVDHRAVDGAVGAEYLAAFKELVEKPLALFI